MNKLTEAYWLAWVKWHLYRKRKGPRYEMFWSFRNFVRGLPNNGLMVDCGSNVGDVSKLFLDKGFTVHAFEPDPAPRTILQRRYANRENMIVHPEAVGVEKTQLTLHRVAGVSEESIGSSISSSLFARDIHAGGDLITVNVIDLFEFLDGLGQKVDILKLDIEGAEADILETMLETRYDRKLGYVIVETHEKFSDEMADRLLKIRERFAKLAIRNVNLDWH